TVGQDTTVNVEVTDDTLPLGTRIELYSNDKFVQTQTIEEEAFTLNSLVPVVRTVSFKYKPQASQLGDTLKFRAKVIDFHQEVAFSEYTKVTVKGDQAPSVTLSNPTEGASFVAGLPIPIRANATDDLGVARVDFFVNDQLVGSDKTAPF